MGLVVSYISGNYSQVLKSRSSGTPFLARHPQIASTLAVRISCITGAADCMYHPSVPYILVLFKTSHHVLQYYGTSHHVLDLLCTILNSGLGYRVSSQGMYWYILEGK